MKIIMPCETVTRYILPALRVSISKKLFEKFKFNQSNIANILGVTQPVISKYLSENYDEKIKLILKNERLDRIALEITESIINKNINNEEITGILLKTSSEFVDGYEYLID
ncbi:MAG: hypothetical protein J4428_01850 [Candidatus Aenigmarchaeota archaeon]|nr:hypothetical protein [Candidatus Aenigmarchaeota archaeon]